ncbi:GNAT family N-acetyltransferase [Rubripirellula amarantea]|nr:GNAT family N-acetyltransferase [Rubripirellula amarantea]
MTQETSTYFRLAERQHLSSVVALLADDRLGAMREVAGHDLDACYVSAFDAIEADPNNELIVAERSGSIVGTLQITYTPNLTHMGAMRATIEGVRVSSSLRSSGIGTRMLQWAIERCRCRGCRLVQLTSDLTRDDAIEFYCKIGFKHTHAGLKLWL